MTPLFATALTCMDGRCVEPISAWAKRELGVQYVDTITQPGMDAFLPRCGLEAAKELERCARISVEHHGSRHIMVVGHTECAGNPVSSSEHRACIQKAAALVQSWNLPAAVHCIFINETWQAEELRTAA